MNDNSERHEHHGREYRPLNELASAMKETLS
jgi:hypothetical protein